MQVNHIWGTNLHDLFLLDCWQCFTLRWSILHQLSLKQNDMQRSDMICVKEFGRNIDLSSNLQVTSHKSQQTNIFVLLLERYNNIKTRCFCSFSNLLLTEYSVLDMTWEPRIDALCVLGQFGISHVHSWTTVLFKFEKKSYHIHPLQYLELRRLSTGSTMGEKNGRNNRPLFSGYNIHAKFW